MGRSHQDPADTRAGARSWAFGPLLGAGVTGLLLASCGFAQPEIEPLTVVPLTRIEITPVQGKTAVIDIMVVDQKAHRLYVADAFGKGGVDIIDLTTVPGQYLSTVTLNALPKGLVIAPDLQRLYSGNDDSTVSVIDINPASPTLNQVVKVIGADKKLGEGTSDLIEYDQKDHRIFVTNPDFGDGFLTAIDATTNTVIGRVTGPSPDGLGHIDQPRFNPHDGMLYVGQTDENRVVRIDPTNDTVVDSAQIPETCAPHGMAINPTTNQGVIGCSDRTEMYSVVWDFTANKEVSHTDLSGAGDAVIYDPAVDQFFFAASNYSPPELAIFSGSPDAHYLTSVKTIHKSNTVAYDEAHNLVITHDGQPGKAGLLYFANPMVGRH